MINDSNRYLIAKYYFNERSYVVPGGTVATTQFYNLPPQIKKLINVTVNVGNVLWQPKECTSREQWDYINTIQFDQDYPAYFFVYNGEVGLFPIPSSSGNVMTLNYKTRITDLSMPDVTCSANIAITTNTTTVTATGATFLQWMAGQWIRVSHSSTDTANGDNQWYQIDSVTSTTVLVLKNPYTGATVSAATATIGEVSILPEDYQDLPLYRMAIIYYTTRYPDQIRSQQYEDLYNTGISALNAEFGSKTQNVVLSDTGNSYTNFNNYQTQISSI